MEEECPVCFEGANTRCWVRTPCRHSLCLRCLLRLARPARCPLCRHDLEAHLPPSSPVLLPRPPREVVRHVRLTGQIMNELLDISGSITAPPSEVEA